MRRIIFVFVVLGISHSLLVFTMAQNNKNSNLLVTQNVESKIHFYEDDSSEDFSFGFKGGIGFWKFTNLTEGSLKYENSYPVGYSAGFFIENKLSEDFSIVGGLLYQNSKVMVTVFPGYEGILDKKVTAQILRFPILLKYQALWLWDTYFLLGPSFGYLLKANYNYYDLVYQDDRGDIVITEKLPKFSFAIELGFGEKLKFSNTNVFLELMVQFGITKFQYKNMSYLDIGEWRNSGLILFMGLEL